MKQFYCALVLALATMTTWAQAQDVDRRHYIYIEASAEVTARADTATVSVQISEKQETSSEAIEAANGKTGLLLASLKKIGVPLDDVETSRFSFERVYIMALDRDGRPIGYSVDPNRDQLDGYRATNHVLITIRDTSLVGAVLGAAVATGGEVGDPTFSVSNKDEYLMQAKEKAAEAAFRKGTLYAKALGTTLGSILAIKEGTGYDPDTMEYPVYEDRGGDGEAADLAVLTDLPEVVSLAEPVPVIVPTRSFGASVSVKWEVPAAN
jgi:uncharacterized protein YggE